jgi:hypothetical protein
MVFMPEKLPNTAMAKVQKLTLQEQKRQWAASPTLASSSRNNHG